MNDTKTQQMAAALRRLYPDGIKPDEYEDSVRAYEIASAMMGGSEPQVSGKVSEAYDVTKITNAADELSSGAKRILKLIAKRPSTTAELAKAAGHDKPYVYNLISEIRKADPGLLHEEAEGKQRRYSINTGKQ